MPDSSECQKCQRCNGAELARSTRMAGSLLHTKAEVDDMNLYRVTMKAYGMTRVRYIEADSAAEARARGEGMSSVGYVTRVEPVPRMEATT